MKIFIQSQIDLITNSSTEVFQIANDRSIQDVKDIINAVLEIGGSADKCDDLFDIKLERIIGDYFEEDFLNSSYLDAEEHAKTWRQLSWDDDYKSTLTSLILEEYAEEYQEFIEKEVSRNLEYGVGHVPDIYIKIVPKSINKNYSNVFDKINYLFEYHEMCN